jgi:hypothetical protein
MIPSVSAISSSSAAQAPRAPQHLFPLTRHLSYRLTSLLLRLPITPNQVTALSMTAGLIGAAGFLAGTWAWGVAGGLMLILCYTLDNCDGEIARIKNMSSEWGARFDDIADWLVDTSFFACLGVGTWSATGQAIWLVCGLAAAAGATVDLGSTSHISHGKARSRRRPLASRWPGPSVSRGYRGLADLHLPQAEPRRFLRHRLRPGAPRRDVAAATVGRRRRPGLLDYRPVQPSPRLAYLSGASVPRLPAVAPRRLP